jgi:hypothetical protein
MFILAEGMWNVSDRANSIELIGWFVSHDFSINYSPLGHPTLYGRIYVKK